MKINPIKIFNSGSLKHNIKNQSGYNDERKNINLPNYKFYQSFMGGYSVNLAQTYNNLAPEQYPSPDIINAVKKEIQNPNTNKTLYDVHFEKYKGILDCYDLSDLIEKYPEFENVLPTNSIEINKGGFLDNYKNGQYEIFNNDEDLTLQLIKLYWGQGFSLSDLSNYIANNSRNHKPVNIHYTMKKLNIPLMNPKYGAVLKLSNKDYNEKFTSEMSIKRLEAIEARQQRAEGEAVIIPQKQLSEAHKKHISESLRKHFQEHPEETFKMSERQKRFYEENPEYKEELSEVMDYAWNKTQEGKSVARGLSKFLKKYYNIEIKSQNIFMQLSSINTDSMETFWQKNSWAKEQFSAAVKKGWKYIKDDAQKKQDNIAVETYIYPKRMCLEIEKWARKKGFKVPLNSIGKLYIYKSEIPKKSQDAKISETITRMYFEEYPKAADLGVTLAGLSIVSFINDLYDNKDNLPDSVKNNENKARVLKAAFEFLNSETPICNNIFKGNKFTKCLKDSINSKTVYSLYIKFIDIANQEGCSDVIQSLENRINEGFNANFS